MMKRYRVFLVVISAAIVASLASGAAASGLRINEFLAVNQTSHTNGYGDYSDWVEIYNSSATTTNLAGWYLTDRADNLTKWQFPSVNIAAGGYLMVYADSAYDVPYTNGQVYASLGLSGSGEYLALVKADGVTVADEFAPSFPPQDPDVSYGIGTSGEERYFLVPTPGMTNSFGFERVATPEFSHRRGFYTNGFSLSLTSATASAEIRYTLDGTTPSDTVGTLYSGTPITIGGQKCVRAVAYRTTGDFIDSDVMTHTYLFVDDVLTQCVFNVPPGPGWPSSNVNGQAIDYEMDPYICDDPSLSNKVKEALMDIPTVSLVTDLGNLFDPTWGIYVNPQSEAGENVDPYPYNDSWERPTSAELIYPDGRTGFQEDAGLRIRGGASRSPGNPKHSFRLRFRSEYGASALDFPLFGPDGADRHNGVELRCASGGAFMKATTLTYAYIRDLFIMDLQLACGHPSTRGDKCHLYVNGAYWGLYETQERIEQASMAEYMGGELEDYDVVVWKKHGDYVDGNYDAYSNLWEISMDGYAGDPGLTNYYRVQGLEADGVTPNPSYPKLLDLENLMDFALNLYWSGDRDNCNGDWGLNNYVCGINRVNPDGFKFYEYDNEGTLDGGRADIAFHIREWPYAGEFDLFTAQTLHQELADCEEYLVAFADQTYKRMFNGGVFSDENALTMFMRRANEADKAMYAESARWGDFLEEPPKTRDDEWLSAIVSCTNWMTGRAQAVVDQLRVVGWYPAIDPPTFYIDGVAQRGGMVTNGAVLTMTGSHPIYYTLDGSDPRAMGGAVVGLPYTGGITLTNAAVIKARTYDDSGLTNVWSAVNEVVYAFETQAPVILTELMYNPLGTGTYSVASADSRSDHEFIEVCNIGTSTVGLADLVFDSGIEFEFKDSSVLYLDPGEHLVLVNNYIAFTNRYGSGLPIAGEYGGNLNDGGERIRIIDGLGRTNVNFIYDDTRLWPLAADGAGHSLVPLITTNQSDRRLDYPGHWRASAAIDGSPGTAEPTPDPGIVINEIVAHTDFSDVAYPDYDSNDWLELFNAGSSNISLADCYLSDDVGDLAKWAIPEEIVMSPGTRRAFDEVHDFHRPITNGFGLNKIGESIYLSYLPGVPGQDRVIDAISFKGQENGAAWGRYPDGDPYFRTLPATKAKPNEAPGLGVLLTEVMYHPLTNAAYPTNNTNDEFIEVFNAAETNVNLYTEAGNWRLDGLGYTFPSNEVIGSGEAILVVTFDPATNTAALEAFTNAYGIDPSVRIFGPCEGLDNRMEKVGLERPQSPDADGDPVSWVIMDEVTYFDQSPWDAGADGTGDSLHRWPQTAIVSGAGNDPVYWIVAKPSPGKPGRDVILTEPWGETLLFEPFEISVGAFPYVSGVAQVEFFANGGSIGVDTTAPYEVSWGTGVGDGTYSLTAVVTSGEGVSTSVAEQVVVYGNPADDSWTKRVKIDFPGYDRTETLTNFPVMLKLSESISGFLYADLASPSDAADLRFGDSAGTTALPYEIEKWDTGGDSYIWVRVPDLTNGSSIYAYYGDPGNAVPAYRTDGTVWSQDFEGVWHMGETLTDSTTEHGGANFGTTNAPGGPGAECRGFDGVDDLINPGISKTWYGDYVRNMTITLWARPTTATGEMTLFGSRNEGSPVSPPDGRKLHMKQTAGGTWEYAVGFFPESASHSVDAGQWQMLTLTTYTNGIQVYYLGYKNGVPIGAEQGWVGTKHFDYDPVIGHMSGEVSPGYYFDGLVDECRVSGVNRSSNWVWSVWTNMVPGSEFVSYGTVQDYAPPGPVDDDDDGMDDDWEAMYYGSTNAVGGAPDEDSDGDGYLNMWEYVAGTDPTDNESHFALSIVLSNGQWVVILPTIEATGTGYTGVERLYDLESRTNLILGDWMPIEFYTNLLGDGEEVIHTNAAPQRIYYRSRTRLQ